MLKPCPDPIDVQDLQFKLQCRLKVFDTKDVSTFGNSTNLISCASRFGLIFCGSNSANFQVIQTKCVEQFNPKDKEVKNYPKRNVPLPSPPSHICVNCDNTLLAVVYEKEKCPWVILYDVCSFLRQKISVLKEFQLSTSVGVFAREIGWNPSLPNIFTACKSDGSLGVYELKDSGLVTCETPPASGATAFCWSPKGKQIAVGSKDGKITQYKPDLKAVKVINSPPLEGPHSLISLQWVSNYQFIGVYQSMQPEGPACIVVVDAPKTGETVFTNYEDVCYSGTGRMPQFFMNLQSHWHLLMVASANSTELGVLSSTSDLWTQWIIADSARAELPLSSDHQETFPVGMDLDLSSADPLPWGESSVPPCPRLLLLSHQGVLCVFNVVNLQGGLPSLCAPPDAVADAGGLSFFKVEVPNENTFVSIAPTFKTTVQNEIVAPKPAFSFAPVAPQSTPMFGGQAVITPASKQVSGDNKYSAIFSSLATNVNKPPPEALQQKPIVISMDKTEIETSTPKIETKKVRPELPKPDLLPVTTPDVKNAAETRQLLTQMIKDECVYLEKELRALLMKGKTLHVNIGTESEKNDMVLQINSLQDFLRELIDINSGQGGEIQDLKQHLIQSWAWYEEAKSRYNTSKDETMVLVLKSQPLDSAAEKRLKGIQHIMYYIESQLTQVNKAVDEQWDEFQNYAKKRYADKLPTMEAIFQTMVRQNAVLQRQSYILRDISGRLKRKNEGGDNSGLLVTDRVNNLANDIKNITLDSHNVFQVQYEQVVNRSKNLTANKNDRLRNVLKNRNVYHVAAVKPQISSLTINTISPSTKSRLSSLSSHISPIKNTAVRNLNFETNAPQRVNIFGKPGSAFVAATKPAISEAIDLSKIGEPAKSSFSFTSTMFATRTTAAPPSNPTEKTIFGSSVNKSSTTSVTVLQSAAVTSTSVPKPLEAAKPFAKPTESQVKFGAGPQAPSFNFTSLAGKQEQKISFGATPATAPQSFSFAAPKTTQSLSLGASETKPKEVAPSTNESAQKAPMFGSAFAKGQLPMFGGTTTSASTSTFAKQSTTSQTPVSSTTKITASSTTSSTGLFGTTTSSEPPMRTSASIFGQQTTAATTTVSSILAERSSRATAISQKNLPVASAAPGIFGPVGTSSAFGQQQQKTTATSQTTPTTFSQTTTSAASAELTQKLPVVSQKSATPTETATSIFAQKAATVPATSASIFGGQPQKTTTTSQPVTTSATSVFAATTKQHPSTAASQQQQPQTTASSIFAQQSTTSTDSVFGQPQANAFNQKLSIFAQQISLPTTASDFGQPVTSASIFGQQTSTVSQPTSPAVASGFAQQSTGSIFGQQSSTVAQPSSTVTSGAFAAQQQATTTETSAFGQTSTPASTATSLFGQPQQQPATAASIFGQQTATATSAFGQQQPASAAGIFGQQASTPPSIATSVFGQQPATAASIFGQQTATPPSTATSVFGKQQQQPATAASIFGQQMTTPPSTATSVFGQQPATAASIFGQQTPTPASTATSVFGQQQPATAASVFGQQAPTPPSTAMSVFGQQQPATTASVFGQQAPTPASTATSVFGQQQPATAASVFGQQAPTPASTATSVFGQQQPATAASVFGQQTPTPASTATSVFGQQQPATAASVFGQQQATAFKTGSVFAGAPTTTSSVFGTSAFGGSPSIFGSGGASPGSFASPASSSSIFGSTAATTTTASVFGGAPTTGGVFGSGFGAVSSSGSSVFGTQAATTFGGGQQAAGGNAFGFGGLNVGNSASAVASGAFGAPAANPFAKTEPKSPFGGSEVFAPSTGAGSLFGSNTGSTFGQASQASFGSSPFGSTSVFGQQTKPAFGQSAFGGSTFGSPQPGPFSGAPAASPAAQSGFGSPAGFQKPAGFGGFGSGSPAFGGSPSFGGSPTFGATATFGSPGKMFGAPPAAAGAFGAPATQQNAGFGNLANQNTIGFGNLAQQGNAPGSAPFSGNSSFSTWR